MSGVPTFDTDGRIEASFATSGPVLVMPLPMTTTQVNAVIVFCVVVTGDPTHTTVQSITGGGLVFTRYAQTGLSGVNYSDRSENSTGGIGLEVWWAPSPLVLSAVSFTVTTVAPIGLCNVAGVAVYGCGDIHSPWDTNGSLPAISASATGAASILMSTSSAFSALALFNADIFNPPTTTDPIPEYTITGLPGGASVVLVEGQSGVVLPDPIQPGEDLSIITAPFVAPVTDLAIATSVITGPLNAVIFIGAALTSEATPPPPVTVVRRFMICGPDWTLTAPIVEMWGFDHLAGQLVYGLADGVPVGPILVDPDGHVTLPFAASKVTLGLSFMPQVQTTYLDAGAPTIQGRRKDITAVTVRVEASQGVLVGTNQPDGAALVPPQIAPAWTGLQPDPVNTDTLTSPTYRSVSGQTVQQLVTGDLRAPVLTTWSTPGQVAIQGSPGLPLNVLAVIPELLEGDLTEASYAREEGGRKEPRGPGLWMLK